MKALGMILVVIGIVGLVWGGISWTQREEIADIGPVEITRNDRESLPIPPVAGTVCLIAGAVLLLAGNRRRLA